ncbi:MAG TPA: rhodanese-like domain-containing protein [Acidobacteriota bacterium]|nr:rhodanese-like domain-containing protein [Acidobacteriota bacterium]
MHLRNIITIVIGAFVLAGLYNTFSGRGIPWVPQQVEVEGAAKPRLVLSESAAAINYIELEEAKEKFNDGALFVDARETAEYRAGHVKGALHISAKEEPKAIQSALSGQQDREIVVYCDGEDCGASSMLAGKLKRLGFEKVHVFFEGWSAWHAAGLPTEEG